jgi:queuosine precursor transporter
MLVALYLAAIVLANLSVAAFGPVATILNAFLFIGLDITTRDRLHERWHGDRRKLAALIAAGSILSYALNVHAGRIALASFLAFAISEAADTLVYSRLEARGWYTKTLGSNAVSALVDSIIFPTLAFGALLPWIIVGQWLAKMAGGGIWAVVLSMVRRGPVAAPGYTVRRRT